MERNHFLRTGDNNSGTTKQPGLEPVSRATSHIYNNQPPRRHATGPSSSAERDGILPRADDRVAMISNPGCLPSSAITNPDITPHQSTSNNYQHEPYAIAPYSVHTNDAVAAFAPQYHEAPYMSKTYSPNFLPIVNLNRNMLSYTGTTTTSQMDSALEILNAEQYDDGTGDSAGATQSVGIGQRRQPSYRSQTQRFGITSRIEPYARPAVQSRGRIGGRRSPSVDQGRGKGRRKKTKISDEEEADEDEGSKKARGRPRLDTKDETAADRRRTQIRMAQRAYRHRKETTISSLERQVQELRGVGEEMSNIFLGLHDFAVGKGLLQREPEFGNHLRSTAARFLALAKSISASEHSKEESPSADGSKQDNSDADLPSSNRPRQSRAITPRESQPEDSAAMETTAWGYQISHQPEQTGQIGFDQNSFLAPSRQEDRQIISRATLDNASFSFDYLEDLQQYRAEVPDDFDTYQDIFSPLNALSPVQTLSQHESSFSRYLQRTALERGYSLITDKNSPPSRLKEVFGFCLRFESREDIAKRIKKMLDVTSKDPLYDWRTPFVYLGGSGTHYPPDEDISGTLTPNFQTGMSMGPFPPLVISTKDDLMKDDFRISLPGFEGEFFDSNDVENYLRSHGINIPPNVEFVTIDLDLLSLNDAPSPSSSRSESGHSMGYSPTTPLSPEIYRIPPEVSQLFSSSTEIDMPTTSYNDPSIDFATDIASWSTKLTDSLFDLTGPIFNSTPVLQTNGNRPLNTEPYQGGRLVALSVTILVEELLKRVVCLGRGSGFRPSDVNSAIVTALKEF